MKKYEFIGEVKVVAGVKLQRIRALVAIAAIGVAVGDLGGWIEKESNLGQVSGDAWVSDNAWVSGNAQVSDDAWVSGDAWVSDNAQVSDDAWVSGNARVSDDARVSGNAQVSGNAWVSGNARVSGNAWVSGDARVSDDARVSGNARVSVKIICASRSDGYVFVVTPTKDGSVVIIAGCRYFGFEEARKHWIETRGGTKLGEESLALVDHLERMAKLQGWC